MPRQTSQLPDGETRGLTKHRGILSYVPILSLDRFLIDHWLPEQIDRRLREPLSIAASHVRQALAETGRPAEISERGLQDWLVRDGAEGILRELHMAPPDRLQNVQKSLGPCVRLVNAKAIRDLPQAINEFIQLTATTTPTGTDPAVRVWNQLEGYVQRLPGDCFFLSALSQFYVDGYVAYLRRVQEIQATQFAVAALDLPTADAVRISRLKPTYKYRLTQQLAAVFADIGLPTEYTAACRDAIAALRAQTGHKDRNEGPTP